MQHFLHSSYILMKRGGREGGREREREREGGREGGREGEGGGERVRVNECQQAVFPNKVAYSWLPPFRRCSSGKHIMYVYVRAMGK